VFGRKQRLYRGLLTSLGLPAGDRSPQFRSNFINNELTKIVQGDVPFNVQSQRRPKEARAAWLDEQFSVNGMQYLQDAYRAQRGVILLSFHGTPSRSAAFELLARRLGSPPIETISYTTSLVKGSLRELHKNSIPAAVAAWVYAEIAFYGQRLLQSGRIIHLTGDSYARFPGRVYYVRIADHELRITGAFAELALNTGAQLLPVFGEFSDNGRLLLNILPPMAQPSGDRAACIQALIQEYARTMQTVLQQHPQILSWGRIRNLLRHPA
jgi:lauroyl/myristoyl acyltransferase